MSAWDPEWHARAPPALTAMFPAMVLNWISQVSFEPRLVMIAIQKTAYSNQLIKKSGFFNVNLFLQQNAEAIKSITKGRGKNPEKMSDVNYTLSDLTNTPILKDASAFLECRLVSVEDVGGDHELFIGEVVGAGEMLDGTVGDSLNLPELGWSYAG